MKRTISITAVLLAALVTAGCFTIHTVSQPATATQGETFTISFLVDVEAGSESMAQQHGIIGLLLPWPCTAVVHVLSYGQTSVDVWQCHYLNQGMGDAQPGEGTDDWNEALTTNFPPTYGMRWFVFETINAYDVPLTQTTKRVYASVSLGVTGPGYYNLRYYVCTAGFAWEAGDITDNQLLQVVPNTAVSLDGEDSLCFLLKPNYPDPFNTNTAMAFNLPARDRTSLSVYNIRGENVAVLIDEILDPGAHTVMFDAGNLPSGVYFCVLRHGNRTATERMLLMK